MKVQNPIIRGFYPDPSVCKAGDKYYMVCSSFEYFPGVPLFESEDLVNWRQIGHCLTRKTQVDLEKIGSSGGVFAPTIRYHEGRFYMVTTNDTYHKNFYVYTDDIYGEWSEPVFVDQGGIDPSLFFEDGKTYFMSNGTGENGKGCIFQCEINVETGERLTESRPIWQGSGGRYLESPHLFRFGEWYYLTAAEGGTEYGHMITYARGKTPYGPFEGYPGNPVLTNRNQGGHENRIQGIGHGDLVQNEKGDTFIVCLGFRQQGMWLPFHHLGREVFLVPVQWNEDGWFSAGVNGTVQPEMDMNIEVKGEPISYDVCFDCVPADSPRWCHLRAYDPSNYEFFPGGVRLRGNALTLDDVDAPTFLGIHQSEFDTDLTVEVSGNSPEAGVTFYLEESHHYEMVLCQNEDGKCVELRYHIGDAQCVKAAVVLAADVQKVKFHIISDGEWYTFYLVQDGEELCMGKARTKYLSSEVAGGFTGTVMAMFAVNPQEKEDAWAQFEKLVWKQKTL